MMIQLMQLLLKLVGKAILKNHPAYGIIAHVCANIYVISAIECTSPVLEC